MIDAPKEPEITIDWIGGNCPVQAEGTINGRRFYFRARWDCWSVEIAAHGTTCEYVDWTDDAAWAHQEQWGDEPCIAGWMPEETARDMIRKAARLFAGSEKEDGA